MNSKQLRGEKLFGRYYQGNKNPHCQVLGASVSLEEVYVSWGRMEAGIDFDRQKFSWKISFQWAITK